MRVNTSVGEFHVSWKHTNAPEEHPLVQKSTTCYIKMKSDAENLFDQLVATAVSDCSKKDTFRKNKGRKYSLTRALSLLPFNKETRKLFWDAYLNRGVQQ